MRSFSWPSGSTYQANGIAELSIACIGVGGMGASDLSSLASGPNVRIAALCDVDGTVLGKARIGHAAFAPERDPRAPRLESVIQRQRGALAAGMRIAKRMDDMDVHDAEAVAPV